MKVGIFSEDDSHTRGFYSKIDGLIKASKKLGLDYSRCGNGEKYDVVINWEPFGSVRKGSRLTIVWVWDTYRHSMRAQLGNVGGDKTEAFDVLFRAHATFYHGEDINPRLRPTYWMPPAVDSEVFKRNPEIKQKYDISWVGQQRYMPEFEILKKHFKFFRCFGSKPYLEYVEALCQGKLILNAPIAHETNKRVMEVMAIGPALMSWGPDYSLLATPDKHFVCYNSIRENIESIDKFEKRLVEKVSTYLGSQEELDRIAKAGRQLVKEQFTFECQVKRIEIIIKRHLK